tara:strand:+ start:133 stop:363 length:231 start_codon:yes stop_codon:yes gene_type:complete
MIKLHPETAEAIMGAFDNYGRWSNMSDNESGENQRYAICRQAKAVMVLVDLGMPHYLKEWAEETLTDTFFTEADYN